MFGEGEECPRPSGLGPCGSGKPTCAWMLAARDAVSDDKEGFWRVHAAAVNARCAPSPIDETDMLGFLGADMFRPGALLHPDDANVVGKRMHVQAGRAKANLKQAERTRDAAVGKAKGRAEKVAAAEQTWQAARARLLSKQCELELEKRRFRTSSSKPGEKRKAAAAASKPASKVPKRIPTSAEVAERAAARDVDAASAAVAVALRQLERATAQMQRRGPPPTLAHALGMPWDLDNTSVYERAVGRMATSKAARRRVMQVVGYGSDWHEARLAAHSAERAAKLAALDAADHEYQDAERVASEAAAQHAAAEAAVWAEGMALLYFEIATEGVEGLWEYGLAAVSQFEAEQLTRHAMDCFAEGRQVEGLALRVEAERATREAKEAERVEQQREVERWREEEFERAHELGACAVPVAVWSQPCPWCVYPRGLGPLFECAKKVPFWG